MSLKARILAGTYQPGSRLAAEDELAASFGASRSTIRQAIADLRAAGYVTSQQGSGTFVARTLPVEPLSPRSRPVYTGFLDDLDEEAHQVHELHRTRRAITADATLAAQLRIPVGSPVVRFRGVRVRDGAIYGVATDVLPADLADRIDAQVRRQSSADGTPIDAYTLTVLSGYGIGLHLVRAGDGTA